ncbi:hypothetical protein IC582_006612 [Cucumis melo]
MYRVNMKNANCGIYIYIPKCLTLLRHDDKSSCLQHARPMNVKFSKQPHNVHAASPFSGS